MQILYNIVMWCHVIEILATPAQMYPQITAHVHALGNSHSVAMYGDTDKFGRFNIV